MSSRQAWFSTDADCLDYLEWLRWPAGFVCPESGLTAWPAGSRLIARRTKLRDGDQLSFADQDGFRLAVFLADSSGPVPELDLDHRGHARVEDRICQGKDCGLQNPLQSFAHNEGWLFLVMLAQDLIAFTQALCLADDARTWELKRLRYRLLHRSGRIARHARTRTLRLTRDWPWSGQLAAAFARLPGAPRADRRLTPRPQPPTTTTHRPSPRQPARKPRPDPSPAAGAPRSRSRTPITPAITHQEPRQTITRTPPIAYCKRANSRPCCTIEAYRAGGPA